MAFRRTAALSGGLLRGDDAPCDGDGDDDDDDDDDGDDDAPRGSDSQAPFGA